MHSYKGTLTNITYQQLVKLFGQPFFDLCDDKTQVEWEVSIPNDFGGTDSFSIYDWKQNKHYTLLTEWNVAGSQHVSFFTLEDFILKHI